MEVLRLQDLYLYFLVKFVQSTSEVFAMRKWSCSFKLAVKLSLPITSPSGETSLTKWTSLSKITSLARMGKLSWVFGYTRIPKPGRRDLEGKCFIAPRSCIRIQREEAREYTPNRRSPLCVLVLRTVLCFSEPPRSNLRHSSLWASSQIRIDLIIE